jgi:hypothetical protein
MQFVADLHIHSHFSRATSKTLNFEHLSKWAQLKGVQVVGTGDIAHPGWLFEMKEKLEPAEDGLFRLKEEYAKPIQKEVAKACQGSVRFMLAGEISNIYKKNDKVRKIHNVVFLPTFEAVAKFQGALEKIGNIRSDGRPILGLDARDLLEIVLETDPEAHLIPAHIWTPWFSLLGSKSGFDSIEECFDDLTPHIFALETGLSSDPPMNWRLSALDGYTLVQFRRPLPAKAGARGQCLQYGALLSGNLRGAEVGKSGILFGHHRVFPGGGQISLRRSSQVRHPLGSENYYSTRRYLPRVRRKSYRRRGASGRGTGRPRAWRQTWPRSSVQKSDSPAGGSRAGVFRWSEHEAGAGKL